MSEIKVLVIMPRTTYTRVSRPEDMKRLKSFANVITCIFDEPPTRQELAKLLNDVDGCITSWGSPKITRELLEHANKLRIIGHAAGSVKPYVCEEAFKRGIVVVHAAPIIAKSVAEFALAMMLNCLRAIPQHVKATREGRWSYRVEKPYFTRDLKGKTIGLVGFGYVARELIKLLRPFDVEVLVYDPYVSQDIINSHGAKKVTLKELLRESDLVSIHAALTEETRHMIREEHLKMMKSTAYLINTARGAIIDEKALVKALKEGWIVGAALDVFESEPLPKDHELLKLDNVILTPHIAGSSDERRAMLFGVIVKEFERFFKGEELHYKISLKRLRVMA